MDGIRLRETRNTWTRSLLGWSNQIAISVGATIIASMIQAEHPKTTDRVLVMPLQARSASLSPVGTQVPDDALQPALGQVAAQPRPIISEPLVTDADETAASIRVLVTAPSFDPPRRKSAQAARGLQNRVWLRTAHHRPGAMIATAYRRDTPDPDVRPFPPPTHDTVALVPAHGPTALIARALSEAQAGLGAIASAGSSLVSQVLD